MKNYFNIEEIEKILTNDELLSGNFGLEKEGLGGIPQDLF